MKLLTEMMRLHKGLWFIISLIVIGSSLYLANCFGGKKDMEPSQVTEGGLFAPQEFKISDYNTSISLFPVPQSNSVGTNDMNNAITPDFLSQRQG